MSDNMVPKSSPTVAAEGPAPSRWPYIIVGTVIGTVILAPLIYVLISFFVLLGCSGEGLECLGTFLAVILISPSLALFVSLKGSNWYYEKRWGRVQEPGSQSYLDRPVSLYWLYIFMGAMLLLILGMGAYWHRSPATSVQPKNEAIVTDEVVNWNTYRNEGYGLEFRHPPSWAITSSTLEVASYFYNTYEIEFFVSARDSQTRMGEAFLCNGPSTKDVAIASGEIIKVIEQRGCILPEERDVYGTQTVVEAEIPIDGRFIYVHLATTDEPKNHYKELLEVLKSFKIQSKNNQVYFQ